MLKRRLPGLLTTRLPPSDFGTEEEKSLFGGVFDAVANFTENVTGIDVDGDGDVGMSAEEAERARQLLETGDHEATVKGQRAICADSLAGYETPTIMLLYLNAETYLGEVGAELGKELLAAKQAGFPIIMMHENDPAKHGCEFGVFFDGRTPAELLKEGIYTALALALYPGEFQATSIALAAFVLGAAEAGPWTRLKARLIEKRKWILRHHKKDDIAPKDAITPLEQTARASSMRSHVPQRSKSDIRAGTSDATPPGQTAAAEPTTVELSTTPSVTTTTPSTTQDYATAKSRASIWLARQEAQLSASDDDLLANGAVLLEATVHWKGDSTFYKPAKVQLLAEPGRASANAEAGAPPWSIIMVHGKAVHYEEVTALKVDEKIFEFVVEHARKLSSRSERVHRQHLRMHSRSDFLLWRDALRPAMASTSDAPTLTTIGGRGMTQHSQTPTPTTRGGAGRSPAGKRASSTSPPRGPDARSAQPSESARVRRAQSENAKEALEAEEHRESSSEGSRRASRV
jgi:hypothetical protein